MLLLLCIVPSPVRNLTASSNGTHIEVTWLPPATPNGIVNYSVVIQERDLLDNTVMMVEIDVTVESILIVEYETRAYHEYSVTVTSQTSAGMGDAVMASFVTDQEGMCV